MGKDANLPQIGWFDENSGRRTHPVARKLKNAWGLHDMAGNVWEWVYDWKGAHRGGSVTEPVGPLSGSYRVFRGGSWYNYARYCRAAYRAGLRPSLRGSLLGFRPSRSGP